MRIIRSEYPDAPVELIDRLTANYFFSSPAFAQLWKSTGGTPVCWVADDKGKVIALLPGVEFGRGIFKRFQSMPDGCYGQIFICDQSYLETEKTADSMANLVITKINRGGVCSGLVNSLLNHGYAKILLNDFHKTMVHSTKYNY
ncbi:MAG: hypothetical protein ACREBV_09915, partial [Candidatus Zixiibacteriota bacterium]